MHLRILILAAVVITATSALLFSSASVSASTTNQRHQHPLEELRQTHRDGTLQWNWLAPGNRLGATNGGAECAACTVVVGLVDQVLQLNNHSGSRAADDFCGHINSKDGEKACRDLMGLIVDLISVVGGAGADAACHAVKMCKNENGQQCRLFQPTKGSRGHALLPPDVAGSLIRATQPNLPDLRSFNVCTIFPQICAVVDHLPGTDKDGDKFAPIGSKTLRGNYWRGSDCNDDDATVYPGAKTTADNDAGTTDSNCNCIVGTDPADGIPYEEKYCKDGGYTVSAVGDSATAHFDIPFDWVTASKIVNQGSKGKSAYSNILRNAENELDWPMLSWSTGFRPATEFYPDIEKQRSPANGTTVSVYLEMAKNNLCMTNSRQNLGVNGARSGKVQPFVELLGATGPNSKPHFSIIAMIGNDVCNSHSDVASMTSAEEFYANYLQGVMKADSVLPPGSVVALVGLADGLLLFEIMGERIHPICSTEDNCRYRDLYDFLNCLQISPCAGWMNSNKTIREATQRHANVLSSQLDKVAQTVSGRLRNIRDVYPILNWTNALKNAPIPKQDMHLLLLADGFHPSGISCKLIAEEIMNVSRSRDWFPKTPNPFNSAIAAQFGSDMAESCYYKP